MVPGASGAGESSARLSQQRPLPSSNDGRSILTSDEGAETGGGGGAAGGGGGRTLDVIPESAGVVAVGFNRSSDGGWMRPAAASKGDVIPGAAV